MTIWQYWWRCDNITLGSLSRDVFEPRTSPGSRDFSSLMRISPFSFKKSSCKCWNESFVTHCSGMETCEKQKHKLSVNVCGSKTSVLKLPIIITVWRHYNMTCGGGVVEWFRVLHLKSGGPWFKSSTLPLSGFVYGSPEFNSSTTLCK